MMCKDCKNRVAKWCDVVKQFVPKKVRINGVNPADKCGKFTQKLGVKHG